MEVIVWPFSSMRTAQAPQHITWVLLFLIVGPLPSDSFSLPQYGMFYII